jgi:hypothetical protein
VLELQLRETPDVRLIDANFYIAVFSIIFRDFQKLEKKSDRFDRDLKLQRFKTQTIAFDGKRLILHDKIKIHHA